jgi:predicted CoA-binding protein
MKNVVVIGASPNEDRYSNKAVKKLLKYGYNVYPVGIRKGVIKDLEIIISKPDIDNVYAVSLYVGPQRQAEWYDYILSLTPKRLFLNPGTENPELEELARDKGIEVVKFCTLVALDTNMF